MQFVAKAFIELSGRELHAIYQLRAKVFVVEQKCAYQDPDDKDPAAVHVCGYNGSALAAYSRLIPPGLSYQDPSIGRVVVSGEQRGQGLGRELMSFSIAECRRRFGRADIVISAQCYLEKFYKDLGFMSEGEPYPEDDIPHIRMRLQ